MNWFWRIFPRTTQQAVVSVKNESGNVVVINSFGGTTTPVQLSIAWHPVADIVEPSVSQLLTWRGRLTPLIGREPELVALQTWVETAPIVSVWTLAGEGGIGKTRLAAEFADVLAHKQGWNAGLVTLDKFSDAAELNVHQNTLLLVDYPEERPAELARLLELVKGYTDVHKLRVLLLTRDAQGVRQRLVERSARHLEYGTPWKFVPDSVPPYELFKAAFLAEKALPGAAPTLPSESAFNTWLAKSPLHANPLFVCAVALTARGDSRGIDLVGYNLLERLAEDEMTKILRAAANDEQAGRAAITAVALATAFNGLSLATLRALPQAAALGLDAKKLRFTLLTTRHAVEPEHDTCDVVRLEPDLYAAAFLELWHREHWNADTRAALTQAFEHLWSCADVNTLVQHWNRLGYDTSVRLGCSPNWFDGWFVDSKFACDHAVAISQVLSRSMSWNGLPRSAATNGNHLLSGIDVDSADGAKQAERAQVLNNTSVAKASAGDRDGALNAAYETVAIYRRLAKVNSAGYAPDLAGSVNNLANRLSETGDRDGALATAYEAVAIGRHLAKASPAAYEPNLAMSVSNLSNFLSATGDRDGALKAAHEAVAIRRRLAEANPAAYEPDLATSVNNLANRLSETGNRDGALTAAREAVAIYRRLAQANPAAYEPDLATSVNNLASFLRATGDRDGALKAAYEAVAIRRRLAKANAAAYEPHLATSVNNLANCLSATGDRDGALKAAHEAVTIRRRLAKANAAAYEPDLAGSVSNLANRLGETGDRDGAVKAAHEAVAIRRRLAKANAVAYAPALARSLCVLAMALVADGKVPAAREAAAEAMTLLTPLAAQWPDAFGGLLGVAKALLAEVDAA